MKLINIFWLMFSVLLWGFIHSLTASYPFKAFFRRIIDSAVFDRFYRLVYNLVAIVTFLAVLVIAAFTPDRTLYVAPFPWVALIVIVDLLAVVTLAIALRKTDALRFLGIRQLMSPNKKLPSRLVKDGPYFYVRHPLYTAGLVFIWLLPFMTARLLVLDLALTAYVITGAYLEERRLKHKFGQEYEDYAAVTPMFIPSLTKKPGRAGAR